MPSSDEEEFAETVPLEDDEEVVETVPLDEPEDATAPTKEGLGPLGTKKLERVGRFKLLGQLGAGGMGVVHRALDEKLGREVALKTIKDDGESVEGRKRFLREAAAAARLRHPGIVTVHEVGEEKGVLFIAMELVAGVTLAKKLERKVPLRRAVEAVRDAARAVQHAHENGVLHRDLKPQNIMVGERVVVLDFGLARLTGATEITASAAVLGTPAYMAPEQANAAGLVTERSDVYSLGATLYHVLVGKPPFEGTPVNVLAALLTRSPKPPSRRAKVPPELETICLKAMERDPRSRYATAEDLATDLDRWLEGRKIAARRRTRRPLYLGIAGAALFLGLVTGLLARAISKTRAAEEEQRRALEKEQERLARIERVNVSLARRDSKTTRWVGVWQNPELVAPSSIAISPDEKWIAVVSKAGVTLHDVGSPKTARTLPAKKPVRVAFFPEGDRVLVSEEDDAGLFRISGELLERVPEGDAVLARDGSLLLGTVAGRPSARRFQESKTVALVRNQVFPPKAVLWDVGAEPVAQPAVEGAHGVLVGEKLVRALGASIVAGADETLTGHSADVTALAALREPLLLSASDDHTVRLWDTDERSQLDLIALEDEKPRALAVSTSGKTFVVATERGTVARFAVTVERRARRDVLERQLGEDYVRLAAGEANDTRLLLEAARLGLEDGMKGGDPIRPLLEARPRALVPLLLKALLRTKLPEHERAVARSGWVLLTGLSADDPEALVAWWRGAGQGTKLELGSMDGARLDRVALELVRRTEKELGLQDIRVFPKHLHERLVADEFFMLGRDKDGTFEKVALPPGLDLALVPPLVATAGYGPRERLVVAVVLVASKKRGLAVDLDKLARGNAEERRIASIAIELGRKN